MQFGVHAFELGLNPASAHKYRRPEVPECIRAYCEKYDINVEVITNHGDGYTIGRWRYDGPHRRMNSCYPACKHDWLCGEDRPLLAIELSEYRDGDENPIRIEAFIARRTPNSEHRIYRRKHLLWEWRDNGRHLGVVYSDLDRPPAQVDSCKGYAGPGDYPIWVPRMIDAFTTCRY